MKSQCDSKGHTMLMFHDKEFRQFNYITFWQKLFESFRETRDHTLYWPSCRKPSPLVHHFQLKINNNETKLIQSHNTLILNDS